MTREVWFRYVAISILFCIVGGVLWPFPLFRDLCIAGSGIAMLMAIGAGIRKIRERDRYSLADLREMVIEGTYDEADVPELADDADVYCMCCHQTYAAKYKVCPYCNRR